MVNSINSSSKLVSVDSLDFDRENPRYAPYKSLTTDEEIARLLFVTADLKELIQSIVANGYITFEPLIVLKDPNKTDRYIVLEGNRRLAALKLLKDQSFAQSCDLSSIPEIDNNKKATLEQALVTEVPNREAARALIGFKHINGPQRWDSFAKGKFAKEWYISSADTQRNLKSIANSLGDSRSAIKRLVFGIFVYEQSVTNGLFDIDDRYHNKKIFAFSHLYTALSKSGYQKFLGIEKVWKEDNPPENPIAPQYYDNLAKFMLWLFGSLSKEIPPIIKSQNPDLARLNEVLEVPKAYKTLEVTRDLDSAYDDVMPPVSVFSASLVNAHKFAEEALGKMGAYEGGESVLVEISTMLLKNSQILNNHLKNFPKS